ncbi:hypothetical protein B0H11DRAFT_2306404 [Mycena galericulata]|nr:hypothetical protein B0H11DRAFT_2306404 [Mycena galericulata]
MSPHFRAYRWGQGSQIRFNWAVFLSNGRYPARIAVVVDDIVVGGLFTQLARKPVRREHIAAQMSTRTPINRQQCEHIRKEFEAVKSSLLGQNQTIEVLLADTAAIIEKHWKWFHEELHLAEDEFLTCSIHRAFRAYIVVIAPWSVVRLKVSPMGATQTRGFGVEAVLDLEENEFIYELSGLLSTDLDAEHTELSKTTSPEDGIERIIFGPIRFLNHDCKPNAEFVKIDHTLGMTIQTNRRIAKGEEIVINYGPGYFPSGCPCLTCNDPPEQVSSGSQILDPEERAKKKKERDKRRKIQRKEKQRHPGVTKLHRRLANDEGDVVLISLSGVSVGDYAVILIPPCAEHGEGP